MICSLNPFYLDKNIILAPEIEGNWSAHQIQSKKDSTDNNSSHWEMADTLSTWSISQRIFQETRKTKQGKDSIVFKPQNDYVVKLVGSNPDSVKYQFKMVVFKINDVLYADFCPYEFTAIKGSRMAKENHLTVHTLARITFQGRKPTISWLSTDCMREMIEKKRVRVKYKYVPDAGRLLLTASSESLTEMIERYAHQKRFIDWENQPAMLKLNRIK
jgi:hypothetical protein